MLRRVSVSWTLDIACPSAGGGVGRRTFNVGYWKLRIIVQAKFSISNIQIQRSMSNVQLRISIGLSGFDIQGGHVIGRGLLRRRVMNKS